MSRKLKIGQSVLVKENGKKGVIKGRDIIPADDKRVTVQYIVKTGEGIDNWKAYNKKELEAISNNVSEYPKYFKKSYTKDGRDLTLVGIVDKTVFGSKIFDIGHALRNPHDESNETLAYRIAKRRAWNHPVCALESFQQGEFKEETVLALMDAKANYIFENIGNFVKE